jgi:hypothetical protein
VARLALAQSLRSPSKPFCDTDAKAFDTGLIAYAIAVVRAAALILDLLRRRAQRNGTAQRVRACQ